MAAITWWNGEWHDGSPPVMGPLSQSFMHGSTVFDGARAFRRMAPDLDRHCARLIRSAEVLGLDARLTTDDVVDVAVEGIKRFPPEAELYVRPVLFAEDGFLIPEGEARFVLTLFEVAMPAPTGFSVCLSRYRRPDATMAPTEAKAACLYPNTSLALKEAKAKGFDNAVMRDGAGDVVEFGTSNLFFAKGGRVITPAANGTFLAGVTRLRVLELLREAGVAVEERRVAHDELLGADEVFSTGNLGKVLPVIRVDDRDFQPGPLFRTARELYFDFAKTETV
jgi:branched-chain amino acid aminotransferase